MTGAHDFDAVAFEPSLERRLPGARVARATRFPRGVSRETWFVELTDGRRLVVRRDLPAASVTPTSLRFEYEVYRRLAESSVPVARPLWYEDDPELLADGRELYVREHVKGSWEVPHLTDPDPRYDELRIGASKEHMCKLALIHTCDWDALGFSEIMAVPPTPSASAHTMLDRLEALLARLQIEPFPAATEAVEVLRAEAPSDAPRVSLLKGTNGIGEEVWRDGRIVAMSDWELACLGDPASDFAHVQRLTPRVVGADGSVVWSREHALEFYERESGIPVSMERVDYYRRLSALETVIYTHNAALPLIDGRDLHARRAWVSTEVLFEAVQRLARTAGIA
jgi:aminoglycoside phosphotransferase (APT) family kinase protein